MLNALQQLLESYLPPVSLKSVTLIVVNLEYLLESLDQPIGTPISHTIHGKQKAVIDKEVKITKDPIVQGFISILALSEDAQLLEVRDNNNQVLEIASYHLTHDAPAQKIYQCKSLREPTLPLTIYLSKPIIGYQERRAVKIHIELLAKHNEAELHDALAILIQSIIDYSTHGLALTKPISEKSKSPDSGLSFHLHHPQLQIHGFSRADISSSITKIKLLLLGDLEMTLLLKVEPPMDKPIKAIKIKSY
ncbi:hypothetical protein [Thiolinea disciformis]|uniref:hypothetical protein n=1 Tax=Thiolinea disciformis TaxID=125614 RepID=UPI0003604169|nr:hypothetical protein [Thiolinea disciformis]